MARRAEGREENHERWLLLRYHALGDVILTSGIARAAALGPLSAPADDPVTDGLRPVARGRSGGSTDPLGLARRPAIDLEVAVEARFRPVFAGNPHVGRIWAREELESRVGSARFDRVLDLQGTPGSRRLAARLSDRVSTIRTRALLRRWVVLWGDRFPRPRIPHVLERYGETLGFGFGKEEISPCVWVTEDERARARLEVPDLFEGEVGRAVLVLPGASRPSKEYPPIRFAEVCRELARAGRMVWWAAPPDRPDPPPELDGCATILRLDLEQLKAVCARAGVVVSSDSGPLHLARGLGLPVVAIFGSSVRAFGFAPVGSHCRLLEAEGLACRPCGVHGKNRCWLGHWRCVNDVDPGRVVGETLNLLAEREESGRTRPKEMQR